MSTASMTPSQGASRGGLAWLAGAVALFCGVPLCLVVFAALDIAGALDDRATAERAETSAAAITHQLEARGSRPEKLLDVSSLYLASPTESLARAELQDRAIRLVEGAHGRLIETQTADPGAAGQGAAGRVAISLSLEANNRALLDLLYSMETGLPLMTVTDLDARNVEVTDATQAGPSGLLRIDMTIEAHWRRGAP